MKHKKAAFQYGKMIKAAVKLRKFGLRVLIENGRPENGTLFKENALRFLLDGFIFFDSTRNHYIPELLLKNFMSDFSGFVCNAGSEKLTIPERCIGDTEKAAE